jgi:Rrf2 family protein
LGAELELNTRGRYAVMALADIADCCQRHDKAMAVSLSDISLRQNLPIAYLEQLFAKLRQAGLVESVRGRSGGYRLARPADEIAIGEIMQAVEEPTRMTRCLGNDDTGCVAERRCITHGLWSALGRHINGFLSTVTLADVISGAVGHLDGSEPVPLQLEVQGHD